MWIFTSGSFLSIVDKGNSSGKTLLVRARKAGDIENVFPNAIVQSGGGTDYAYRARINREEVAQKMAEQVRGITYSNFKNTVKDHARHDALMGVWQEMYAFQNKNILKGNPTDSELFIARSSKDTALIEKYTSQTWSSLKSIGHELLSEISHELTGLTMFMTECQEHPTVNVTLGCFASIEYRLCDAFKQIADIGMEAINATDKQPSAKFTKIAGTKYFGENLASYQAHLGTIADRLEALHNSVLCFLPCDLDVLKDHPEVAKNRELANAIKLINEQLDSIQGRLDEICELARRQSQSEFLNEAPPLPKNKDRAWEAMSKLLMQCIEAARKENDLNIPLQDVSNTDKIEQENDIETDGAHFHPKLNNGMRVKLDHPSKSSSLAHWHSADMLASATPHSEIPSEVNGIAIQPWIAPTDAPAWETLVSATKFDEPAFKCSKGKAPASGAVVIEPDGRVWVVSPSNQFGGYTNTFPKGKVEAKRPLSLRANALKEVFEEAGLKVELTDFLCDSERTTTTTRLYLARRVGGSPADCGWESQAVHLVPREQLSSFVTHGSDLVVLRAIDDKVPL